MNHFSYMCAGKVRSEKIPDVQIYHYNTAQCQLLEWLWYFHKDAISAICNLLPNFIVLSPTGLCKILVLHEKRGKDFVSFMIQ